MLLYMEKLSLTKPRPPNSLATDRNLETPSLLATCVMSFVAVSGGVCFIALFYFVVTHKGSFELEAE